MRSRSISILLVGLLALVVAGCSQHMRRGNLERVRPVSDQPRAGNAYLLRGFIGIFSSGIDNLTKQINETGIRAHVYQDDQWPALARAIRREYADAPRAEPLVLIGHSYGADDVIRIARELDKADITVDLLVTLDPVTPPPVPKNVRHAVNIYRSNGVWDSMPWLRGVPVKPDRGFSGRLDNFDIRGDRPDLLGRRTDHFNIEKQPEVHEEVIGHLIATCPPRQTWLAMRQRTAPADALLDDDAQTAGHRPGN